MGKPRCSPSNVRGGCASEHSMQDAGFDARLTNSAAYFFLGHGQCFPPRVKVCVSIWLVASVCSRRWEILMCLSPKTGPTLGICARQGHAHDFGQESEVGHCLAEAPATSRTTIKKMSLTSLQFVEASNVTILSPVFRAGEVHASKRVRPRRDAAARTSACRRG